MSAYGGFAKPGQGAAVMTVEREIFAQGFEANRAVFDSSLISGAARDAGNTPTTLLRPGNIMGKITASGKLLQWDTAATDGSQNPAGILWKDLRAQDFDANDTDRHFTTVVGGGVMNTAKLLIKGVALVGHTDEYLARRFLAGANFVLDDDPFGYLSGKTPRYQLTTGTAESITASQNGSRIFYNNVAAVAITLPTLIPGLEYWFYRTADEEIKVSSVAGDDIVVGNDLSADSVTVTTAGQQIGQIIHVFSTYIGAGATLRWIIDFPVQPFGTGLTGGFAYSIAT